MLEKGHEDWVSAFFGSREAALAQPRSWDEVDFTPPSATPVYLNHGYDESKPLDQLGLNDMKEAAEFRGGACPAARVHPPVHRAGSPGDGWEGSAGIRLSHPSRADDYQPDGPLCQRPRQHPPYRGGTGSGLRRGPGSVRG